jgi:hypothetical protein
VPLCDFLYREFKHDSISELICFMQHHINDADSDTWQQHKQITNFFWLQEAAGIGFWF